MSSFGWLNTYRREVQEQKKMEDSTYDVYNAIEDLQKWMGAPNHFISQEEFDAILEEVKNTQNPRHREEGIQAILESYNYWCGSR